MILGNIFYCLGGEEELDFFFHRIHLKKFQREIRRVSVKTEIRQTLRKQSEYLLDIRIGGIFLIRTMKEITTFDFFTSFKSSVYLKLP